MNNFIRIDDIQDNSILRRGIPVAHSIYGVASTINAANYVMFIALEKVNSLQNLEVSEKNCLFNSIAYRKYITMHENAFKFPFGTICAEK